VTDVLYIVQFSTHGQQALMGLNIAFLLFNVCVDVALMPDWRGRLLSVLQLQQAVQAVETLSQGKQTVSFVRSKKVDAVCRSVPSVVLQLYGLLLTLPSLGARGVLTIGLSVAVGVVGSATTLGSLAPKSGSGLFSSAFAVHWCYYVCELSMRLVSMSLLFVSLGPVAFAVLGADFLYRLRLAWQKGRERWSVSVVMQALLWFGSDDANGPDEASIGLSMGSDVILLISLFLANLLDTPALALLRADPGGPVQGLTALACVAWLFKIIIGSYIAFYFKAPLESFKAGEQQQPAEVASPAADDRISLEMV